MIRVDGFPIDTALEERISYEAEVSTNPVEKGADITDHVTAKLPKLDFDGVVSDTPIGAIADDPTRTGSNKDFARAAYLKFLDIFLARQTVVVECSYGKFDSMILQSLTPVKNAQTKKAFKFTATFQQIKIIENKRTTVRTSIQNGGKQVKRGLSLDNIVEGNTVLWRKGKPPGRSPSTVPPGVIVGQETLYIKGKETYHQDRKTKLTHAESEAFVLDLTRDTALYENRQNAKLISGIDAAGERIKRAQALLELDDAVGGSVDPILFGL